MSAAEAPSSSPPSKDSTPPAPPLSPPPGNSSPPSVSHTDGVSETSISSSPPGKNDSSPSSPPPATPEASSPPPSSPPPAPPKSSPPPPSEAAPNPPSSPPPSQKSEPSPASPPPSSPQQNSPSPPASKSDPPPNSTPTNTSPPNSGESPPSPQAGSQSPPTTSTTPVEFVPPPPISVAVNSPPVSAEFQAPPPPISLSSNNTPSNSPAPKSGSSDASPGTTSPSSTNNTSTAGTENNSQTTKAVIGGVLAGTVLIAIVVLFFILRKRKNRKDFYTSHHKPPKNFTVKTDVNYYKASPAGAVSGFSGPAQPNLNSPDSYGSQLLSSDSDIGANTTHFNYNDVMEITRGFSRQNIIGEGGFGCVFKGYLSDGKAVAVKQLKVGSGQGDREFKAEVEIISRVHHRHLVSLVGYCISDRQRLLLYEFVSNKTLEHHLHGEKGMTVLDWPKRLKIAIGSAKGLAYLHEDCHPKIIHRDIKSANILLDDNFDAQVADFGLARLNDSAQTHVSTRVMGTFGYLAPEYASSGKLTDRSDVFSFGVVLLELVTGRKPVDSTQPLGEESLVEWARPLLIQAVETGDISELVDPRLEKRYVEAEMFRMIETAAACVRHSAPKRPRMAQVVRALDCDETDLTNGVKYGQSTAYNSGQYNEEIMNFRRTAFSTDTSEFDTSGEFTYTSGDLSSAPLTSHFTSREFETQTMRGKR